MQINDLLVFVKVVQTGSFSLAAKQLGMPKSTVSRRVAELEKSLGVPLIHRTTRKLQVTDIGSGYYEHGRTIAAEIEKAETLLTSLQSIPQGKLKVTAPVDFGHQYLAPITRSFLEANRRVSIDLVLTERIVDLVGEGFDLAIRIGDLEDSTLMARKLSSEVRLQLFASPKYLKKRGEPKKPDELKTHDCVLFTGEEDRPVWTLRGPRGAIVDLTPKGRAMTNNMLMVRDLAIEGEGVALLPRFFCNQAIEMGELKPVLPDWSLSAGPIHAVFPGQKHLLPKVRAYVDHLTREFKGGIL